MSSDSNIWYPFTQMRLAPEPIHIVRGKGSILFDAEDHPYIDAISSWWTNLHGHAHPYLANKVFNQFQQLEHVLFAGFTHTPAQDLAGRLLAYLPDHFGKIFYSDNGSTSVEVALKMAIQYFNNKGISRKKVIAFTNAYHGDTFGSMSVSDRGAFTKPFHEFLFDVQFISAPLPGQENKCIAEFKACLGMNDIAAFIYEPLVMGAGGMLMYESKYLDQLIELARTHKIICIADEVMTGFYRTGKMFASDYCNSKPDIICLSKGLTGGSMALGVTACAQYIFEAFYTDNKMDAFYHGHSFTANPLACSVANASLDLLEREDCVAQIRNIIASHKQFALQLINHPQIENCRQTGTILAFDLKTDQDTNYFNPKRDEAYGYFIKNGVLLRPLGNTIYLMPPYCITGEELNKVYQTMLDFISSLQG